jgi:hypothetical protein
MNDFGRFFGLTLFATYGLVLMPFLLLSLAIPYAVLRLRGQEGREADPQVGLKVLLYFFFSTGVLLFLTGATIILVDAVTERSQPVGPVGPFGPPQRAPGHIPLNSTQRTGSALALTGALFALLHWVLVKVMTNDRDWPAARRLFAGWRLAIHGLILLMTVTALMVTLFQEDTNVETIKTMLAIGFVWSMAWIIDLMLLWHHSRPPRRVAMPPRALPVSPADD